MTAPVAAPLNAQETMIGTANGPGLWIAPAGTKVPEDGAAFTSPWESLGYASDDGPTISGDTTSESITPWQSKSPIRTIITERSLTMAFVMWQLNERTLSLYFDTTVPEAVEGVVEFDIRSDSGGQINAIAIDSKDGDSQFRIGFSRATLESAGDMQLQKGAMVPLDVTLSALEDNGVLGHVYVKVGEMAAGGVLTVTATPDGSPAVAVTPDDAAADTTADTTPAPDVQSTDGSAGDAGTTGTTDTTSTP